MRPDVHQTWQWRLGDVLFIFSTNITVNTAIATSAVSVCAVESSCPSLQQNCGQHRSSLVPQICHCSFMHDTPRAGHGCEQTSKHDSWSFIYLFKTLISLPLVTEARQVCDKKKRFTHKIYHMTSVRGTFPHPFLIPASLFLSPLLP